jgi:hypothetical protein
MGAEEAHHERLIEIAATAHRCLIAINLARAVASLHSAARPTPKEIVEVATADAAAVAADKALADWRARPAPV